MSWFDDVSNMSLNYEEKSFIWQKSGQLREKSSFYRPVQGSFYDTSNVHGCCDCPILPESRKDRCGHCPYR